MTAVIRPEKAFHTDPAHLPRCVFCGNKVKVPYVEWAHHAGTRVICALCCRWSDGLVADLQTIKCTVIARKEPIRMEWVSDARQ